MINTYTVVSVIYFFKSIIIEEIERKINGNDFFLIFLALMQVYIDCLKKCKFILMCYKFKQLDALITLYMFLNLLTSNLIFDHFTVYYN